MARRRRTVRFGARTRTDRAGRYMLVYDYHRARVMPARAILARAPTTTTPLYSRRRTTETRSRLWRDRRARKHQETFSFFLLRFIIIIMITIIFFRPPDCDHRTTAVLQPPANSCTRTHTRARTHTTQRILCTRPQPARVPSIIIK